MSRKKSRPGSPFVVTLTLIAAACGGETAQDGAGGNAGNGGNAGTGGISTTNPPPPECPATMPDNGTACADPGASCSYGDECCTEGNAVCVGNTWQVSLIDCNPPPPLPCPNSPPVDGSSCAISTQCGSTYDYCSYGTCGDGAPAIEASCDGSAWHVLQKKCAQLPCEALDACGCFAREDCQAMSDGCLCECDYACDGKPPCDCICGGGTYLGCKPVDE